jgi:hypothetical protein
MTEGWAIALLTGALTGMIAVLGWVAYEIRTLHKSLTFFVQKTDCYNLMGSHCKRIDILEKKVDKNCQELAAIRQYHNMIKVPIEID